MFYFIFQLKNVRERLAKNLTEKGVLTTEKQVKINSPPPISPMHFPGKPGLAETKSVMPSFAIKHYIF